MPANITLHDLFPDLSEEESREIAETLHSYCATVWRIFERLEHERPEIIDDFLRARRMNTKVDFPKT
jgi:hypothetical protein